MKTPVVYDYDELAKRLAQLERRSGSVRFSSAAHDLKKIHGITAKFERVLHAMGYSTYAQVAEWSDADVKRVAQVLQINQSTIFNGRWREQAKELAKN